MNKTQNLITVQVNENHNSIRSAVMMNPTYSQMQIIPEMQYELIPNEI